MKYTIYYYDELRDKLSRKSFRRLKHVIKEMRKALKSGRITVTIERIK